MTDLQTCLSRVASFCDLQSHGAKDEGVRAEWLAHGATCRDAAAALEQREGGVGCDGCDHLECRLSDMQQSRDELAATLAKKDEEIVHFRTLAGIGVWHKDMRRAAHSALAAPPTTRGWGTRCPHCDGPHDGPCLANLPTGEALAAPSPVTPQVDLPADAATLLPPERR